MATILLRRGTWAEWQAANPVLKLGEPGYETDTGRLRVGDGTTRYINLPAFINADDIDAKIADATGVSDPGATQDTAYGDATTATFDTDGRGEIVIPNVPVADTGTVSSIRVRITRNSGGLSTAQVQLLAMTRNTSGDFVVTHVSPTMSLPVGPTGQVASLATDFEVAQGEYVGLQIQSGISVGYDPNVGSGIGYYYDYNRSDIFTFAANDVITGMTALDGNAMGFAFTLTSPYDVADSMTTFMGMLNPLMGKSIAIYGDSMASGYGVTFGTEDWGSVLATRNSMTMQAYGVAGTYLSSNGADAVVDRYSTMPSGADYVTVFAGTNDANGNVALGAEDSTNKAEFNGALNVLCDGLLAKYPISRVAFITPYRYSAAFDPYIDAIVARCALHGIAVFNNRDRGGLDWSIAAQKNALGYDSTHLSVVGHQYAARKYEAFLRTL
ncbi:GDSL-type esterase/lipase family protein [Demequina soli]|uniref:hyaluronate lyase N-terminal domain-containing protein n=1 Tax=Demequina soli TaxID=1638987 RepID=UPI0007864E9C|nr:GDSL-type esterase/lipase family protein [Demequina soli]